MYYIVERFENDRDRAIVSERRHIPSSGTEPSLRTQTSYDSVGAAETEAYQTYRGKRTQFYGDNNTARLSVIIWVAGKCSNNNRKDAPRNGSCGVYFGSGTMVTSKGWKLMDIGNEASNRVVLFAILMAIKESKKSGFRSLFIRTTNEYSVNVVIKWVSKWITNEWIKPDGDEVKNQDVIKKILEEKNDLEVHFEHVKKDWEDVGIKEAEMQAGAATEEVNTDELVQLDA